MENKACLYNEAIKLIEKGDYLGAYNNLRRCKTHKDSKKLLRRFETLCDKQISYTYDANGDMKNKSEERYDENGNAIFFAQYDADGNEIYKTEWEYDEKGNMIGCVTYNENGETESETEYEYRYDENGNILLK
ncbi:MAG: hypothetical protein IJB49_01330, partial [Clostridia bacterium]|nr:hypothetical protein [Clostridia bacterium]